MDIQPTTTQPISDDQELAKALAGIADEPETPEPVAAPLVEPSPSPAAPVVAPAAVSAPTDVPVNVTPTPGSPLDLTNVKQLALTQLRPLIDRVDLPPEEKFDAYLMLIRSTDDSSLVQPAHAAAQSISDEKRRAEALLEIIKEIDFLSNPQK